MQVNIYKRDHEEGEPEVLVVSGEIHPANLGYWLAMFFEPDTDLRIEVLSEENDDEQPLLEEDVVGPVH